MVQVADGGGGGGNAGPQERKLIQAYQANLDSLEGAAKSWSTGAQLLTLVANALGVQAGQLETSFGPNNPTGKAAADRYREVQEKVKKRADEMTTASTALTHSRSGLVAAQADYDALPPVTTNPNEPQTDLERLMDPGGTLKKAQYDGERAEREKAAGVALTKLDTHFEKSAKDLRTVAGDAPSKNGGGGGGGGDESGGGSPLAGRQGGGTHVVSGVPSGGGDGDGTRTTLGPRDGGPDRGPDHIDPPLPDETGTPTPTTTIGGTLAGSTTDGTYGGSTSGGSYGGGSTATPTSGSGAGVTSAMGAGVVSGAGAIAASRGGVAGGARVAGAPASSSGAIGRSSSTAARGAIGRGGSMVPGQGSTAGRTGGTGGRGAAGGRTAMGAGQGQAGKNGGRGGAGARGRGGAMGAGQGGRGGKKDEKDVTQEHLAFADEESWLDDEGANDSVID